ncbi:NYN domain-containing protein [Brevundimonas sp.]|uniref:NYN domain-containing protein n=1 Tax=Brevundimonas sp. TaxID=1871086 RepID=UPI001AC79743|nr:NYN domain-containing protein [Brevundimonas sp.]
MTTAWFVDGGYASKTWQSVAGRDRLDYALLRQHIETDAGEVVGDAYYFDCDNDPPSAGQTGFHRFLSSPPPRGPGLRVKLYWLQSKAHEWPKHMGGGPIIHPESGGQYVTKTQKAVDVGLSFHLMRSFSKRAWNKLYLIAGDGDFSEVIQHLVENENVSVTLIGTNNSVSGELAPYVRIMDFADIKESVTMSANANESPRSPTT